MLKNKTDLKQFYTHIASLDHIFKTIVDQNNKLEKEIGQVEKNKTESISLSDPQQNYLIQNIKNSNIQIIMKDLFAEMEKYQFIHSSSIPHHAKNEKSHKNNYDLLAKINLYQHTLNVCKCSLEVCREKEVPQYIAEIVMLIALLHDFGKEERIADRFKQFSKYGHHIISAKYAQIFLKKYVGKQISADILKTILITLNDHHNNTANETEFLILLREADGRARDREEESQLLLMEEQENDS